MADAELHIGRFLILLVGILCLSSAEVQREREITIQEYHCGHNISECKNTNHSIIDVIAKSDDNSSVIHYLWSIIGSPTIIAAYFEKTDVNLTLNWKEILNKDSKEGIQFLEVSKGEHITPNYITAFVIPAIYEFQDPKDELFYTGPDVKGIKKHSFQTENVTWESPAVDKKHNMTTFKAGMLGGSVIFQCNASASQGTESVLPHQKFTSNSTVFTLTLDNLKSNQENTRFIFELVSFSIDKVSTCITAERSLDDEHTPAVFKTIVVNSTGFTGASYNSWKPVAYNNKIRSLDHQVPSWAYYGDRQQSIKTKSCASLPSSSSKLFHSIVHHLKSITFTSHEMNISFGQRKDGWYEASPYLSWSAMVGYGKPEYNSFSTLVWIVIFVGFGAPMLLIVISIVYIIVKKIKAKKTTTSYGMIN